MVIPRRIRDAVGLRAGEVEITEDGAAVRIEPISDEALSEKNGRLVIPASGVVVDDQLVRDLRDADQR